MSNVLETVKIAVQLSAEGVAQGSAQVKQGIQGIVSSARNGSNQFGQSMAQIRSGMKQTAQAVQFGASQISQSLGLVGSSAKRAGADLADMLGAKIFKGIGISILTTTLSRMTRELHNFVVEGTFELDKVRKTLQAVTGSAAEADRTLQRLYRESRNMVGVTGSLATSLYTQLKVIGTISESSINKAIQAVGRLNAAFDVGDPKMFVRNMQQLFDQAFERGDWKEAIGRVPIFDQIIESAFDTKDPVKLRKLQQSGKLTADVFWDKLSTAVNENAVLKNIPEAIGVQFDKVRDRVLFALEPVGREFASTLLPYAQQFAQLMEQIGPSVAHSLGQALSAVIELGKGLGGVLAQVYGIVNAITGLSSSPYGSLGGFLKEGLRGGDMIAQGVNDLFHGENPFASGSRAHQSALRHEAEDTRERKAMNQAFQNEQTQTAIKAGTVFSGVINPFTGKGWQAEERQRGMMLDSQNSGRVMVWTGQNWMPVKPDAAGTHRAPSSEAMNDYDFQTFKTKNSKMFAPPSGKKGSGKNRTPWVNDGGYGHSQKVEHDAERGRIKESWRRVAESRDSGNDLARKRVEERATRSRLTLEFDEQEAARQIAETDRGIREGQRVARRQYGVSGQNIDDLLNAGSINPGDAEALRRGAAGEYANELERILELKRQTNRATQEELDVMADEIQHFRNLSTATSDAQKFMRGFRSEIRTLGDSFEDLGRNISNAFGDVENLFSSLKNAIKSFLSDITGNVLRNVAASVLGPLLGNIPGLSAGQNGFSPNARGGGNNALASIGQAATGIFSNGAFGNGLSTFSGQAAQAQGTQQMLREVFNSGHPFAPRQQGTGIFANGAFAASLAGKGGGLVSSLKGAFSGAAGPLFGASIGGMLGGKSAAGSILGSAGGALATGFATASLGLMGTGTAAALFSNPITAIAGAGLLVGSYFLGKAKQRKSDESVVDTYWSEYARVTDQLTRDVRANRVDGDSALAQAMAARQNAIDQIGQIKTKSVRESRLKNQIPQIDRTSLASLKAAISEQKDRRDNIGRYVPEFETGGVVPGPFGSRVPAFVHAGEVVLNQQQRAMIGERALADAGVPGVKGDTGRGGGGGQEVHVTLVAGTETQDQFFVNGVTSRNTRKQLGQTLTNIARYGA